MARNKDEGLKEFLISIRKSVSSGLTNVPTWLMQKAGKRITSRKRRGWRRAGLGKAYRKQVHARAKGWKSGYKKPKTGMKSR
jgi:ribosomal protein L39E